MRRLIVEISLDDLVGRDPASKFRKIESLEVVHFLKQDMDRKANFEGIIKVVFKDRNSKIEEIFPTQGFETQLLSEDKKSGSRVYFIRSKRRARNSNRYVFTLGVSLGYVSLPFEIKDQKVKMSFLGSVRETKVFLKRLQDSWPAYKLVSLSDAKFSESSPLSHLTEKQRRVLLTAFNLGYYETPRRISSEGLAAKLNIDSSTLIVHRRKAEQRALAQIING